MRLLRPSFDRELPVAYDPVFPDQRWSTFLLLDAHPDQALVAITPGLSPRISATRALLPVATYSVIEPMPRSQAPWQQRLTDLASRHAQAMPTNRSQILSQP